MLSKLGFKRFCAVIAVFGAVVFAPNAHALEGEVLLTGLPEGFKVASTNRQEGITLTEYIPQGDTSENWSEMVTVLVANGLGHIDPNAFAQTIGNGWSAACPNSEVEKIGDGEKTGYATSLWLLRCPLNPQTGRAESLLMIVIQGKDSLYNIQYAFRSELTEAESDKALAYLSKAQVCDTRRADNPCPPGS